MPNWLCVGCFVFLALCPLVPINVCAIFKDAFFSWAYLFFLLSVLTILDKGKSVKYIAAFTIVALLISLTKKIGIYVSVATCLGIAAACWKQGMKAVLSMVVPAVTCIGIVSIVLPGLLGTTNIQKDGEQEMLSVPLQQSALAYMNHGSSMTEEEIAVL